LKPVSSNTAATGTGFLPLKKFPAVFPANSGNRPSIKKRCAKAGIAGAGGKDERGNKARR